MIITFNLDLAGKDVWEQSRVDELADLFLDVHAAFKPFTYVVAGIEKGDQVTLLFCLSIGYNVIRIFRPNFEKQLYIQQSRNTFHYIQRF